MVLSKILLSYIHEGRRRLFGRNSCRNRCRHSFGGGGRGCCQPRSIAGEPGRIENSLMEHLSRIDILIRVPSEGNQSQILLRNFMQNTEAVTAFTLSLLSSPEPLSVLGAWIRVSQYIFFDLCMIESCVVLQVIRSVPAISTRRLIVEA